MGSFADFYYRDFHCIPFSKLLECRDRISYKKLYRCISSNSNFPYYFICETIEECKREIDLRWEKLNALHK